MTPTEHRDEVVRSALRVLQTPEHEPDFFERLVVRLDAEPRPAPVTRRRSNPRRGLRWSVRIAVAIAAVTALVLVVRPDGDGPIPLPTPAPAPEAASAAEVTRRVAAALDELHTLRGTLTSTGREGPSGELIIRHATFVLDDAGRVRLTRTDGIDDVAYDPVRGVERSLQTSASMGEGTFPVERRGVAPGLPDHDASYGFLGRQLAAAVRALAAADDARVEETTIDGRPAWRLVAAVEPNTIAADADRLEVVVDRATSLPLRVRTTLAGRVTGDLQLADLVADAPLPEGSFALDLPAGAEVARSDDGFRRVAGDAVDAAAGYAALVPATLPAGFEPGVVAVAHEAPPTAAGANPPSRDVVSRTYRRGIAEIAVTTRRAAAGDDWRDPFAVSGVRLATSTVRLRAGALRGAEATLVRDPRSVPHLWVRHDGLVLTVAGDATGDELVAVAESLRRS